jgi:hypothetical protein
MGRTIDIFYTHREGPGGNGKEPLTLCTPIGTDQGVMGRTIGTLYTYRERPGRTGKACRYLWEGPLISFIPIGKDLVEDHMHLWERPSSDGKDLHALVGRTIHTFHTQHSVAKAMKVRPNTITLFNVHKVVNHKIQMIG